MRWISDKTTVWLFGLLSFIEAVKFIFSCTLDGSLIIWVDIVTLNVSWRILVASLLHTVHLQVFQEGLEGLHIGWVVSVDEVKERPTL